MTFKSIKFDESEIMKSFEKVAYENGLITPDVAVKTASACDLTPSDNFMENIVKLCSGLRLKGFDGEAAEIESSFLAYKSAKSKVPVGEFEKIMRDGHDPSPTYGDSAYGLIENIFEEHEKIMDVINRTPTGKLSTSSDVMSAVKKVLAEVEVEIGDAVIDPTFDIEFGEAEIDPQIDVEFGEAIVDKKASSNAMNYGDRMTAANLLLVDKVKSAEFARQLIIQAVNHIIDNAEKFTGIERVFRGNSTKIADIAERAGGLCNKYISNLLPLLSKTPITEGNLERMNDLSTYVINEIQNLVSWLDDVDHNNWLAGAEAQMHGVKIGINIAHKLVTGTVDEEVSKTYDAYIKTKHSTDAKQPTNTVALQDSTRGKDLINKMEALERQFGTWKRRLTNNNTLVPKDKKWALEVVESFLQIVTDEGRKERAKSEHNDMYTESKEDIGRLVSNEHYITLRDNWV